MIYYYFIGIIERNDITLETSFKSSPRSVYLEAIYDNHLYYHSFVSYAYNLSSLNLNSKQIGKKLETLANSILDDYTESILKNDIISHELVDNIKVNDKTDYLIFRSSSFSTWSEANKLCSLYGYQLPQLTSNEYQQYLLTVIKGAIWLKPISAVYIGLYRKASMHTQSLF